MLASISIPNMISGVSQQPPTMRFPSQAAEQVNCYQSVVDGLVKRPPSRHVALLSVSDGPTSPAFGVEKAATHFINRDPAERYVLLALPDTMLVGFGSQRLRAWSLDGTQLAVSFDGQASSYLQCPDPSRDLRFLTIADYTFVVNRTKTVALTSVMQATRNPEALVTVVAGNYGSTYVVKVGGSTFSYTTSNTDVQAIDTKNIAAALYAQMNAPLTSAGYTVSVNKSTIWIRRTNDQNDFAASIDDGQSQSSMTLVKDEVASFDVLPVTAPDGFVAKVISNPESTDDEYWVRFRATDGYVGILQDGVWEETIAPGASKSLDPTTMPHVVVREGTASAPTFRVKPASWAERTVGDQDTAPAPSIVGRRINDLFFFRNRLGFLASDRVVMSEASGYFNLWRTTVTTVIDSDPIDVAVAHTRVSNLEAAVPFNDRLILFSPLTQFSLTSTGQVLGPATVAVTQTTEFEGSLAARPVATGRSILFAQDRGEYSGIREYYPSSAETESYDSIDVTANVSRYLRGDVLDIDANSTLGVAVVRTDHPSPDVYVWKWFVNGSERVQSAWSRWRFTDAYKVLGSGWIDSDLHVVVARPFISYGSFPGGQTTQTSTALCLERIRVQDGQVDAPLGHLVHLDRRTTPTRTFDAATNLTSVVMPNKMDPATLVVTDGRTELQFVHDPSFSNGFQTRVWINGDWSGIVLHAGQRYAMRHEFGTPFVRSESRALIPQRCSLTYGTIVHDQTSHYVVRVTPKGRSTYQYENRIGVLQSDLATDSAILSSGTFRFPIHARNDEVSIVVENDSHMPCRIVSAEIEANYHARSRAS